MSVLDDNEHGRRAVVVAAQDRSQQRSLVFSARTRCRPSRRSSTLSAMPTGTMLLSSGRIRRRAGSHGTSSGCRIEHRLPG